MNLCKCMFAGLFVYVYGCMLECLCLCVFVCVYVFG